MMIIRSRAPLRLGLAGGGTDLISYSELYGGAVLNATINMYAYANLEERNDGRIILKSIDCEDCVELKSTQELEIDGRLPLLKGVYNKVVKEFTKKPLSFTLSTYVDAPPGSGLGSSSTLIVAILGVFAEWLKVPLSEYEIAQLAYEIEREDLNLAGGKQDQYAAAFGGCNFMEFHKHNHVLVNPLRIKDEYLWELEFNLLLYLTQTSRVSSQIIEVQSSRLKEHKESLEAMHRLKDQAFMMKKAVLEGNFSKIGEILDFGWKYKKQTAEMISNPMIDEMYEAAIKAGSTGGKMSGAGGGGFMMFYCPGNSRYSVIKTLKKFGGEFRRYNFVNKGLTTWKSESNTSLTIAPAIASILGMPAKNKNRVASFG